MLLTAVSQYNLRWEALLSIGKKRSKLGRDPGTGDFTFLLSKRTSIHSQVSFLFTFLNIVPRSGGGRWGGCGEWGSGSGENLFPLHGSAHA